MKRFVNVNGNSTLIVGTAREIKSFYKNMVKADLYPVFTDEPRFNMERMYGITYNGNADSFENGFVVINEKTCLEAIMDLF